MTEAAIGQAVETPPREPLIEIEDLTFRRGDRLIFDGLNMVVPTGKITALMGPSGCWQDHTAADHRWSAGA